MNKAMDRAEIAAQKQEAERIAREREAIAEISCTSEEETFDEILSEK